MFHLRVKEWFHHKQTLAVLLGENCNGGGRGLLYTHVCDLAAVFVDPLMKLGWEYFAVILQILLFW